MHGADVVNGMKYFMQLQNRPMGHFEAIETLSAIVASVAHNVGHDSEASRFQVTA